LVGKLKAGIAAILSITDPEVAALRERLVDALHNIILADEVEDRRGGLGADELLEIFRATAEDLRKWMAQTIAEAQGLAAEMRELADALEAVAHHRRVGTQEYVALVNAAAGVATKMKREKLGNVTLDRKSLLEIHETLFEDQRLLQDLVGRLDGLVSRGVEWSEIRRDVSLMGWKLSRCAQFDLDRISPGLADRLRPLAKRLHLVGRGRNYLAGGRRAVAFLVDDLRQASEQFRALVASLLPK
jgi:hypothetical protein